MRGALAWPGRLGAGGEEADPGAEAAVQRRRHRLRVLDWFAAAAGGVVWWWARWGRLSVICCGRAFDDVLDWSLNGPVSGCLVPSEEARPREQRTEYVFVGQMKPLSIGDSVS
jgi:hypothetical protein